MPGVMASAEWRAAREAYRARMRPRAEDRLKRTSRHEKHPVHDFLFEYYSFRPSHLMRWSPGWGVRLDGAARDDIEWPEFEADDGLILHASAFPRQRIGYLEWAVQHLEATLIREPNFACFGLHEWAMVYRDPNVRHPYVPLRLPRAEIDAFVESQSLRCTHYDAFRFFTKEAAPRNRVELTRSIATEHEQPGCIHANMDLYRFAYKIAPFGPSELLADAFGLADAARAVDMRASPYDLAAFGFPAIPIETREGREEYVEEQRRIAERAAPIRERMLVTYERLWKEVTA
ncbi:MAG: 3-methyladenine DNA glycosylase [Gemmataceae bacterium]